MNRETIDISQFSTEIGSIISMYSKNIANETEQWMSKTARECAKDLRESPNIPVKSGRYKGGWTATKRDGRWIVHNKTSPGLAHLLEHGHQVISHGAVAGSADAFPHIETAQNEALAKIKDLITRLKKVQ